MTTINHGATSTGPVVGPRRNSEHMTALQMLEKARDGRIFTVEFIKRTTGELRRMNARRGVKNGVTGKGIAYDAISRGLLPVWDVHKEAHRMINLAGLVGLSMGGKKYLGDGRRFERVS
jgi:hypothetical protein